MGKPNNLIIGTSRRRHVSSPLFPSISSPGHSCSDEQPSAIPVSLLFSNKETKFAFNMSQNRHRSVPKGTGAPLSPPSSQTSANFAPALTASKPFPDVAYSSTQTTPNSPKSEDNQLSKQAEALANMHFELNLHTVFSLASRLEKEVQQLVFRTADDQEFRRQNEERMTKMMIEVQTVKAYMARMGHNHEPATRADIERLQQAMSDTTMEWNNQLEGARTKIDEISGRMINVSRHAGVRGNEPQTSPSLVGIETRAMRKAKTDIISSAHQQQSKSLWPRTIRFPSTNL
ncbi:hypothetical protein NW764_007230 [Fusarium oxysporum]|nr:hypothetical protein NW764_007230 [Fusarium oxysporum]